MKHIAKKLQGMGRKGDTILAHINPAEAELLDRVTDGGSRNPRTGLLEFEDADSGGTGSGPSDAGGGAEAGGAGSGGGYGGGGGGDSNWDIAPLSPVITAALANNPYSMGGPSTGVFGGSVTLGDGTTAEGGATRTELGKLQDLYAKSDLAKAMLGAFGFLGNQAITATGAGWAGGNNVSPGGGYGGSNGGFQGGDGRDGGPYGGLFGGGGLPGGLPPGLLTPRARVARPTLTRKWGQPRGLLGV